MNSGKRQMRVSFNSVVILGFTIACFVVMMLDQMTRGGTTYRFFSVYRSSLLSPLTYIRFFGHVLGHAGWQHFFGNIMMILVVGPLLEEKYFVRHFDDCPRFGARSFYLFPECQASGSERSRICLYPSGVAYEFPGRKDTAYLYFSGFYLHWAAGI